ncbi:MAG: hypothetical protein J0H66_02475 [Solirubrobacterales bacterium]|nr:hypothetical protein [Solirubrobacterales bacterium]
MTKRFTPPALGLLLGLAMLLGLAAQPAAAANKIPVNLRVVTYQGKIIFDSTVKTGTATIKPTSDCPTLGGRTGPARTVTGATALGLLYQASLKYKALRPLKVSDSDFGFGVCGIGGTMAEGEQWWSLYQNYKATSTGAETTKLKKGDSVLYFLSETWQQPNPDLLFLKAPAKVRKGAKVKVRVFEYDSAGKRSPVSEAKVSGGASAVNTNAQGYAMVKITGKTKLVARQSGLVPSNRVYVSIKKNKKHRK